MKKYREYMDSVGASDTLHQRLLGLETSGKRPIQWKKYGTMAAALVLVVGLGAWGLSKAGGWGALKANFNPLADHTSIPEIADAPVPDIALAAPGDAADPGQKTIGGYEVISGSGENAIAAYYILPYIEYGPPSDISAAALLAEPAGGLREATRDDALALVGGEDALTAHLDWGGSELRGSVGFEADGTVWMLSLWGEGKDTAFSLELSPGRLPPTCCVVIGEQRTITNVWGVEVSGVNSAGAYGDTERGIYMDVSREVEFIANGVGCRLKAYGTQDGAVEELVSRFVRWAVLEGLDLSGISPDGATPLNADPNYGVGEPNYENGEPGYDSDCPYCVDGTPHTHPYNAPDSEKTYTCRVCGRDFPLNSQHGHPFMGADSVCPNCGAVISAGADHDCVIITCPDCGMTYDGGTEHHCAGRTHTCDICGEVLPIDMEHSHEVCGYPLAPPDIATTRVCEVCGQSIQDGVEHSHHEDHHDDHHGGHH